MKKRITLLLLFIIATGCSKQEEKSEVTDSGLQTRNRGEIPYQVKPLDNTGLKQMIARRNGKWLLLNVWATWCQPCREEFPDLVKLADKYRGNVEVVGFSVNYPDEVESKIIPFLDNNPVNFTIYVQNFKHGGEIIQSLNRSWNGAIPATFIFDPTGILRAFLLGLHSYDDFDQELEKAMKLQKP